MIFKVTSTTLVLLLLTGLVVPLGSAVRAPLNNSFKINQASFSLVSGKDVENSGSEYVLGELIVKFKQGGNALNLDISQRIANVPSLCNLHENWGVQSYKAVFKSLESQSEALGALPELKTQISLLRRKSTNRILISSTPNQTTFTRPP